jgi:hypothetical protein
MDTYSTNQCNKDIVPSEELLTYHRRGHWFKSSTAHHTVQWTELACGRFDSPRIFGTI